METSYNETETRTRSGERYRGKGLKQLLDLVDKNSGNVRIWSGKGHCCFSIKNNKLRIESAQEKNTSIGGTLIEWKISL